MALGEVAYSESEIIEELISTAKVIIDKTPPRLKIFEVELEKYFIDDYYKDFEDALINNDFVGVKIIRSKIINRCIDIFCKIHQIRREKDKRVSKQIEALDPAFEKIIRMALNENWNKINSIEELRITTEKLLGGRRTKEWKLRSPLDL